MGILLQRNVMGHYEQSLSIEQMCVFWLYGCHYSVCDCYSDVKLIPGAFQSLDGGDKRLQKVRVILLTPKCSVSAVSNPVEFILQENGGTVMCALTMAVNT